MSYCLFQFKMRFSSFIVSLFTRLYLGTFVHYKGIPCTSETGSMPVVAISKTFMVHILGMNWGAKETCKQPVTKRIKLEQTLDSSIYEREFGDLRIERLT